MKIPSEIQLFSAAIHTIWRKDLLEQSDALGLANYRQNTIELQEPLEGYPVPQEKIEQSYFHELTHHILNAMQQEELRDDETFVPIFSRLLHQALTSAKYDTKPSKRKTG